MINPATFNTYTEDGTERKLIIEPILKRENDGELADTRVYRLLKNSYDNDSLLFTEPLETTESNIHISDNNNPDFLGKIIFADGSWIFEGDLLSEHEQQQLVGYIIKHS